MEAILTKFLLIQNWIWVSECSCRRLLWCEAENMLTVRKIPEVNQSFLLEFDRRQCKYRLGLILIVFI